MSNGFRCAICGDVHEEPGVARQVTIKKRRPTRCFGHDAWEPVWKGVHMGSDCPNGKFHSVDRG